DVVTYTTQGANGAMMTNTMYYYYRNDIIIVSFSPEGEIKWLDKIPKTQVTVNDGGLYSSYAKTIVGDKIYFLFNDHPQNLAYSGDGKLYNFNKSKGSIAVIVGIDSEGQQTRRDMLFAVRDVDAMTIPTVSTQVSDNEMVIFSKWGKRQRLVRATFK
ncbi:MAG: hypothetical protein OEX02_14450, partial [Cyclobacteriaceae bacterium]|nr:hypothetical protein [Cyclobacteriaceae bacterium]